MPTLSNTFDAIANGTSFATVSNTAPGGDAYDASAIAGSGGTLSAQTTSALHGARGCAVAVGSVAGTTGLTWTTTSLGGTITELYRRFYIKVPTGFAAAGGAGIVRLFSGGLLACRFDFTPASKVTLKDASGTVQATSSASYIENAWMRMEVHAKLSTTAGVMDARLFFGSNLEGSTPDVTVSASGMVLTASTDNVFYGMVTGPANTTISVDTDKLVTGAGTWIGSAFPPPTAAFSYSPVGFNLNVDGTGSSAVSPATIASYDWNWGDASTHGTGSTASHSYAAANTYVVTLTVTDTAGSVGTVTHNVTIASVGRTNTVAAILTSTGWTASTGSILSCVTDGDPTTLITSSAPPTAQVFFFTMGPVLPPASGQPYKVFVSADLFAGSTGFFDAQLYENDGTTLRSSLTNLTIASGSGSSVSNVVTITFPAVDCAAMSTGSWSSGVKVKLLATGS